MDYPSPHVTPTGLQSLAELTCRRRLVMLINLGAYALLLLWLGSILGHRGWSVIDRGIFVAFAIAAPWSVLGVCNAAIGFWLLHFHHNPISEVAPFARAGDTMSPVSTRTAMLFTIRNEQPARALARLRAMHDDVDASGEGGSFEWFVLSDTTDPIIAEQEDEEFALWRAEALSPQRLHYRRRDDNIGYKAGNIRDFCDRWGFNFEFMIPLDADSLMDAGMILRLVRIGEAHPEIGILQTLVVGAPAASAFARIFQFGMRHGMRTYTMGATWWAGDCGPYWGHNALVRIAPFVAHCVLPKLEGDTHILSHDQIEAALMRRAGFEVRVLPFEGGSYEENPPTVLDFASRDLRWCEGNMQYLKLLGMPGLLPMSRFQLVWAVSMFIGAPAWIAIIALSALKPLVDDVSEFPVISASLFYLSFLVIYLSPKLAGCLDVVMTKGGIARYGGPARFAVSVLTEVLCSFVIGAVTTLNASLFLIGLPFGRVIGWKGQARDLHAVTWRSAAKALWPHLLFGAAIVMAGAAFAPRLLLWSLPLTFGYLTAIPFAVATASALLGAWFGKLGVCAVPEEYDEPPIFPRLRHNRFDAAEIGKPERPGVLA